MTEQTVLARRPRGWWVPVAAAADCAVQAFAVWWNSTPARLLLLNRGAQRLTCPTWQPQCLPEIRIPKPESPVWESLATAWDEVHDVELLPMRQANVCAARRVIDATAAVALDVGQDEIGHRRRRLAREPTIANARAPDSRKRTHERAVND